MTSKAYNKQYAVIIFTFIAAFIFLLFAYYPSLGAPHFSTDDSILINISQIKKAFELESVKSVFEPGHNPDYYPVRDLSYMVDQYFWNSNPFTSRLHQLVLFFISSIFLFLILTELKISAILAISMTMVWLIHPYHAETIMWLSARKDILAILFALAATYFSILAFNRKKVFLLWISVFFFFLSILSKASFTLLPFVLIAGLLFKTIKINDRKFYYPILVGLLLCLISSLGQSWHYSTVNNMQRSISFADRLSLSVTSLGRMTLGWILPRVNAIDLENYGEWLSLNFRFFYGGLIVWTLALAALAIALIRKKSYIIYFLLTLAFLYIPISGIVFSHSIFYSTRYFEPIGIFLILLLSLFLNHKNIKFILIGLFFTLSYLGLSTIEEGKTWNNNIAIREKALLVNPESISLQSLLFFDIINDHSNLSSTEEIKNKKSLLIKSLEKKCSLEKATNESCRSFYYQAYYINRWNKRYDISQSYLTMSLNLLGQITPRPRAYERLQVEQMILDNKLNALILADFFSDTKSILVSENYRYLFLMSGCLLNRPVNNIKKLYIKKNLLIESEFESYILENTNPALLNQVKNCFI